MTSVQPPSTISHVLPPSAYPINVSMSHKLMGAEPLLPSRLDLVVPSVALSTKVSPLPTCPSKNPVSRPVRHFGPPPGFSTISSKQQEEPINGKALTDNQPLEDEYSWLNGYQFSSTTGTGTEKSLAHMEELAPQIPAKCNNMAGMIRFPFPGKQIPTMQAQVDHGKRSLDSQFIENRKLYTEQQFYQEPQLDTLPDQYQGQSLWAARYFVLGFLHLLKMRLTVKRRGNIVQLVESFHYLFGVDETCLLQSARHIKWTMVALFPQRCESSSTKSTWKKFGVLK
ncbi:hypothetical protein QJS10_CPB13g00524 [Acorus calamus]|uniref:Uncharacterized protein n=1 Tax=Acorus calamus TaxID=4465 RepID=A0AAV9DH11_ACOCL|nr:hypothetical protein QJS10_CPB13g00524 [Acorus calamus]